ncbi:mucin-5AC-like isoform X1 [Tigriopus californicus]|uniref:mucin-5AC-like isoform X1 n=1 Tax=Tigriopus californicus TaxID=6832 RepID=UPI0027DAA2E5|nr:mucin-5AC-like isoform X1 [Tigriopus californicus]
MKGTRVFRSHSERVVGSDKIVKISPDGAGLSPLSFEGKHHDEGIFEDQDPSHPSDTLNNMKKRSGSRFRLLPNFMGGGGGSGGGGGASTGGSGSTTLDRSSSSSRPGPRSNAQSRKISSPSRHSSLTRSYHPNYDSDIGDSPAEGDTSLPVLLAVRKRACSDSGHETNSSHNGSPGPPPRPQASSRPSRGGIFRLFHKSATLLFQHPTTELNPNKPYKASISMSTKDLRPSSTSRYQLRAPIKGSDGQQANHHHPSSALSAKMGGFPTTRNRLQATLSASSSSSINSSVMHHHLEHDSGGSAHLSSERGGSNTPSTSSGICSSTRQPSVEPPELRRPPSSTSSSSVALSPNQAPARIHSSSSNSVISSSIEDDSNYDSGAFSRTSTPEIHPPLTSGKKSLSQIHLALAAPLSAPSLVMEACNMKRSSPSLNVMEKSENSLVDASHILACLNAASSSSIGSHLQPHSLPPASSGASGLASPTAMSPSSSSFHNHRIFPQTSKHVIHHGNGIGGHNTNSNTLSLPYYSTEIRDDVSITIGLNTKLTITQNPYGSSSVSSPSSSSLLSHLRRTRSGLPVLGTAGLNTSCLSLHPSSSKKQSPVRKPVRNTISSKNSQINNSNNNNHGEPQSSPFQISTVYVGAGRENPRPRIGRPVSRSESCVTLSNTTIIPGPASHLPEQCTVTVNGQQYTSLPQRHLPVLPADGYPTAQKGQNPPNGSKSLPPLVKMSVAPGFESGIGIRGLIGSSIDSSSSDSETQPSSLINI